MIDLVFEQTMSGLIHRFRKTLRTLLPQDERMKKLKALGLRSTKLYTSSVLLYEAGQRIVADIEQNFNPQAPGSYYAYDGLREFSKHMRDYLDQFECHECMVIHKSQVAAQSLLKVIQLITPPKNRYIAMDITAQIKKCACVVANYGTAEQQALLVKTLMRQRDQQPQESLSDDTSPETNLDACLVNRGFYQSVLDLFNNELQG